MEINVTFGGNKRVDAEFNGYVVKTDQPVRGGGDGTAPSPFEYFLASLATCAGIYVLGFLQSRNLPSEGVTLTQRHEFDPVSHRLSAVTLAIKLPAAIPEKYHEAIIRTASMCAVKKALQDPPAVAVVVEPV
ncbi:MAG: osmotically inducible protein C [Myxococcales bacterium]|nr:osmotically inducible protein C [Myxococcales bacterium]